MHKHSCSKNLCRAKLVSLYVSTSAEKKCSCIEHGSQGLDTDNTGSLAQGEPVAVG